MQLKECMEDTADNKMWGDWMLINLCVLCSVQYFSISSWLASCSWLSRLPLKGMTKAPGSWLSTHSLIFTSLLKRQPRDKLEDLINMESFVINWCMHIHESSWTHDCVQRNCTPKVAFLEESATFSPGKFLITDKRLQIHIHLERTSSLVMEEVIRSFTGGKVARKQCWNNHNQTITAFKKNWIKGYWSEK